MPDPPVNKKRRRIIWLSVTAFLTTCFLMFIRFFLPRSITEPASTFKVGFPGDYALGATHVFIRPSDIGQAARSSKKD